MFAKVQPWVFAAVGLLIIGGLATTVDPSPGARFFAFLLTAAGGYVLGWKGFLR